MASTAATAGSLAVVPRGGGSSSAENSVTPSIAVVIPPGWSELTRTPLGPNSSAATLVSPRTPHFDAT